MLILPTTQCDFSLPCKSCVDARIHCTKTRTPLTRGPVHKDLQRLRERFSVRTSQLEQLDYAKVCISPASPIFPAFCQSQKAYRGTLCEDEVLDNQRLSGKISADTGIHSQSPRVMTDYKGEANTPDHQVREAITSQSFFGASLSAAADDLSLRSNSAFTSLQCETILNLVRQGYWPIEVLHAYSATSYCTNNDGGE